MLVFSQRGLEKPVFHAAQYELEDLVAGLDDVDLLAPPRVPHPTVSREGRRLVNGTLKRLGAPRRTAPWPRPSMRRTRVAADHDLFFAVFHSGYQIAHLHRLPHWRDRCRTSACLLVEMWARNVPRNADYLRLLADFDVVYVQNPAVIPLLHELGLRDVRFLPLGIDALAFSPLPHVPPRSIDFLNYGRSSPATHRAALDLVDREGVTYLYDSRKGDQMTDHREHRALTANLLKRTRFFFAYSINDGARRSRTGGDEALSGRYFEGAAAGAVMLGSLTDSPEARAAFDWPDAVVPVPYDTDDLEGVLSELGGQPDRLAAIRSDGVCNALRRHDWLHRWGQVLADVGLAPTTAMRARADHLEAVAEASTPERLNLADIRGTQRA